MTNEERQQAIEWLKRRPVMMAGAKRMYDLAVEALEAYVPDMNDGNMISRQAAIDAIQKLNIPEDMCVFEIMSHIEVEIATLPPVQPKHGKWIDMPYGPSHTKYMCSECGKMIYTNSEYIKEHKFCFSCGADMRCSENPNS